MGVFVAAAAYFVIMQVSEMNNIHQKVRFHGTLLLSQVEQANETSEQIDDMASQAVGLSERVQRAEQSLDALQEMSASQLAAGTVLSYVGDPAAVPTGWVVCGQNSTPDLSGRFLMGASDVGEIGELIGSSEHEHPINLKTSGEVDGQNKFPPETADNWVGTNWFHRHKVEGTTDPKSHIPPAVQVLFLCKLEG